MKTIKFELGFFMVIFVYYIKCDEDNWFNFYTYENSKG